MYLTPEEFTKLTGIEPASNFTALEADAQIIIDRETTYRIFDKGLSSFSPQTQSQVKQAMAKQVVYLDENGGLSGASQGISSASLGKFSYTQGDAQPSDVAPGVTELLFPTGLLYRGC